MSLDDIIALAKQGYKPNDVKELIALSKETINDNSSDSEDENSNNENTVADGGESDHTTQTENHNVENNSDELIDYKKLYEEEHSRLLNAQKNNIHQNMAGDEKSDEEVLYELFKNIK